ncbi:MAG: outer membrane beta-barrel protein [Parvibaculaceae bacterium]
MNSSNRVSALTLFAASLATTIAISSPALAEDGFPAIADQRGTHVLDRERPEFDAVGIRAGSFMLYPELELGVTYDDNVFGTQNNTDSDIYYGVSPSVSIESDFGRHELNFNGYTDSRFYSSDTSEDRFDWGVAADGIVDVSQFTQIQANVGYDELTEDRTSTNRVAGGIEPTEYDVFNAGITLNQRFNRLTASVGARYTDNDYKDDAAIGGGVIDQDFRDHEKLVIPVRLSYDVSPDTSIFVAGSYNTREYDQQPPAVAVNRDSNGYDVGIGAAFDFTNLIRGEAFVGYLEQEYDQVGFQKVDGIDFGLNGEWYASELTTVTAGINRTVEESSSAGSSGHLDTTYEVGIAHELQRNIILTADASYLDVEFEGITRDDETISAGVGVQYLVNRNAELELGYDYTSRDSSAIGQDYDKSVVGLSLVLKM